MLFCFRWWRSDPNATLDWITLRLCMVEIGMLDELTKEPFPSQDRGNLLRLWQTHPEICETVAARVVHNCAKKQIGAIPKKPLTVDNDNVFYICQWGSEPCGQLLGPIGKMTDNEFDEHLQNFHPRDMELQSCRWKRTRRGTDKQEECSVSIKRFEHIWSSHILPVPSHVWLAPGKLDEYP